eukprot:TRINITY_DN7915_c0_g1_i1.p2 TRINITY_DN7915_c0_g1~~TRINITY_DN7915_c0_g1_i1.p2  ORF type:complete len:110 (+),score=6.28 TRINITY_DN7915_c0_g1_i1:35-364(+)
MKTRHGGGGGGGGKPDLGATSSFEFSCHLSICVEMPLHPPRTHKPTHPHHHHHPHSRSLQHACVLRGGVPKRGGVRYGLERQAVQVPDLPLPKRQQTRCNAILLSLEFT